jgi:magnesium chelatase family protein
MTEAEALETATIDSVLGVPLDLDQWFVRPFRAPHHTASAAALVGGGSEPRPGEISRAHNGVLFLDELPEFPRHVLEVLREPLEAGRITISRARRQDDFPAAFQLVAAMNPCPCGYLGDPRGDCSCSAEKVKSYRGRISGPLLDRIDLHIEVGRPPHELLRGKRSDLEGSAGVQQRVVRARERQLRRQQCCNARLTGKQLGRVCDLQEPGWQLLDTAAEKFGLSVRSYQRILRVARTVADLAQAESIASAHVAEALAMRGLKAGNVGNAN